MNLDTAQSVTLIGALTVAVVTLWPLVKRQVKMQDQRIAALEERVKALEGEVKAVYEARITELRDVVSRTTTVAEAATDALDRSSDVLRKYGETIEALHVQVIGKSARNT